MEREITMSPELYKMVQDHSINRIKKKFDASKKREQFIHDVRLVENFLRNEEIPSFIYSWSWDETDSNGDKVEIVEGMSWKVGDKRIKYYFSEGAEGDAEPVLSLPVEYRDGLINKLEHFLAKGIAQHNKYN